MQLLGRMTQFIAPEKLGGSRCDKCMYYVASPADAIKTSGEGERTERSDLLTTARGSTCLSQPPRPPSLGSGTAFMQLSLPGL